MNQAFEYARIGDALVQRMTDMLRRGENLVILGPRNVGKRYVLRALWEKCQSFAANVAVVPFLASVPDDVALHDGNEDVYLPGVTVLPPKVESVVDWVDRNLKHASAGRPVVLLAANVDAVPHQLVEEVLGEIGARLCCPDNAGKLAAAITGEVVLKRHLPELAWCRVCFTLVGFEKREFEVFARRYLDGLGLRIEPEAGATDILFERSGGNLYVLRLMLWVAFDRWASDEGREGRVLRITDLPDRPLASQIPWNYYMRYLVRLITLQPDRWWRLEDLIHGRPIHAAAESDGPDELELAGLARREGDELRLGKTPVHECLTRYFNARRIADLYASEDRWQEAFERYRLLPEKERVRPVSLDDVNDAENAVKDLSLSLFHEAVSARGSAATLERFAEGCVYLLGFPEVSIWAHQRGHWVRTFRYAPDRPDGPEEWYHQLLPSTVPTEPYEPRELNVPQDLDLSTRAALITPWRLDQPEVILIGEPGLHPPLSLSRRRSAKLLLRNFLMAHGLALGRERDNSRAQRRDRYASLVNRILTELGIEILDVSKILETAGDGLCEMGYKRVLFCLISSNGECLEAVWESPASSNQLLMENTHYELLSQSEKSIHLKVLKTGESHRTPNFQTDPEANQGAAAKSDLRGGAIVALQTEGRMLGTLLVDTGDRGEPTPREVVDLEEFANKLAAALEQGERINLLQSALTKQREPVLLLDSQKRVRYANPQAASYLKIPAVWSRATRAEPLPETRSEQDGGNLLREVKAVIDEGWQNKRRLVRHLRLFDGRDNYRTSLLVDRITDWRSQDVGILANSQDLTDVYTICEVLTRLQEANRYEDAKNPLSSDTAHTQRLIETTFCLFQELLARDWGVLYLADGASDKRLVLRDQFGLPKEDAREGTSIELLSESADAGWEVGYCLRNREPVVFVHEPERPDRLRITTDLGLEVLNVAHPLSPPVAWEHGSMRIDFPLLAGQKALGKLVLPCSDSYFPEHFLFMKLLSGLLSGLLESSFWFERTWGDRNKWLEESAEFFQRGFYHYLGNRLADLSNHEAEFEQLIDEIERSRVLPSKLIDRFRLALAGFGETVRRVSVGQNTLLKWTLGQFVRKERVDLCGVVREAVAEFFGDQDTVIFQLPLALYLDADSDRLKQSLFELMENSRQWFKPTESEPRLRINLSVERVDEADHRIARVVYLDNGPGIDSDDLTQVFKRTVSGRPGGTGFGLYYAAQVLFRHGGKIWAEKPPERGVRFVLEFPLPSTPHLVKSF